MATFSALPQKIKGVIFDCDGVIIDSRKPNSVFYNKILDAFGLDLMTEEQETYTYMATVEEALLYIIPKDLHPQISEVVKRTVDYRRDIMPMVELEKGFLEFVTWLKEHGVYRAIHTNRAEGMRIVTDKFSFLKEFSPIMTADIVQAKPHPEGIFNILSEWNFEAKDVIFVGDSKNDQKAALAANVPFVAYNSKNLDGTIAVDSYEALQNFIAKLV